MHPAPRPDGDPTLDHPVVVVVVAVIALVVSAVVVAVDDGVSGWEADLTLWVNGAPDPVATALVPVMALGTVWAALGLAAIAWWWSRDRLVTGVLLGAVAVTWASTRVVKHLVGRGRPAAYLDDVDVRDDWASGLGWFSGHSSMAATLAMVALALVPRRWRVVPVVLATLVGLARIVHGVHFPTDVVAGWAFGTLVGVAALAVIDRFRRSPR